MMSEGKTHSKIAVASTILPFAVWLYLVLMYVLIFKSESGVKFINRLFGDSFGALGVAVILFIFLFGVVPIGGHLAGLIFGIIGMFSKNKKRVFAVAGLILNALPLAAFFIYRLAYGFISANGD